MFEDNLKEIKRLNLELRMMMLNHLEEAILNDDIEHALAMIETWTHDMCLEMDELNG